MMKRTQQMSRDKRRSGPTKTTASGGQQHELARHTDSNRRGGSRGNNSVKESAGAAMTTASGAKRTTDGHHIVVTDEVTDEQGLASKPRATPHALIMQTSAICANSNGAAAGEPVQEYDDGGGPSQMAWCDSAYNDSIAADSVKNQTTISNQGSLNNLKQYAGSEVNNSFSQKSAVSNGHAAVALNNSTTGVATSNYQLQGMQRSIDRVNNLLGRPGSVLSSEESRTNLKPPISHRSNKQTKQTQMTPSSTSKKAAATTSTAVAAQSKSSAGANHSATKNRVGLPLAGLPKVVQSQQQLLECQQELQKVNQAIDRKRLQKTEEMRKKRTAVAEKQVMRRQRSSANFSSTGRSSSDQYKQVTPDAQLILSASKHTGGPTTCNLRNDEFFAANIRVQFIGMSHEKPILSISDSPLRKPILPSGVSHEGRQRQPEHLNELEFQGQHDNDRNPAALKTEPLDVTSQYGQNQASNGASDARVKTQQDCNQSASKKSILNHDERTPMSNGNNELSMPMGDVNDMETIVRKATPIDNNAALNWNQTQQSLNLDLSNIKSKKDDDGLSSNDLGSKGHPDSTVKDAANKFKNTPSTMRSVATTEAAASAKKDKEAVVTRKPAIIATNNDCSSLYYGTSEKPHVAASGTRRLSSNNNKTKSRFSGANTASKRSVDSGYSKQSKADEMRSAGKFSITTKSFKSSRPQSSNMHSQLQLENLRQSRESKAFQVAPSTTASGKQSSDFASMAKAANLQVSKRQSGNGLTNSSPSKKTMTSASKQSTAKGATFVSSFTTGMKASLTRNRAIPQHTGRSEAKMKCSKSSSKPTQSMETKASQKIDQMKASQQAARLEILQDQINRFDFSIFANQKLQKHPGLDGQMTDVEEDMLPYNVFQRFCVLLLSIHGHVDKYKSGQNSSAAAGGNQRSDTLEFLKTLQVYQSIMKIDETIRQKHFTRQQLEILVRENAQRSDELQIFINSAVGYALSLLDDEESCTDDDRVETSNDENVEDQLSCTQQSMQTNIGRRPEPQHFQTLQQRRPEPISARKITTAASRSRMPDLDRSLIRDSSTNKQNVRDKKSFSTITAVTKTPNMAPERKTSQPSATMVNTGSPVRRRTHGGAQTGLHRTTSKGLLQKAASERLQQPLGRNRNRSTLTSVKTQQSAIIAKRQGGQQNMDPSSTMKSSLLNSSMAAGADAALSSTSKKRGSPSSPLKMTIDQRSPAIQSSTTSFKSPQLRQHGSKLAGNASSSSVNNLASTLRSTAKQESREHPQTLSNGLYSSLNQLKRHQKTATKPANKRKLGPPRPPEGLTHRTNEAKNDLKILTTAELHTSITTRQVRQPSPKKSTTLRSNRQGPVVGEYVPTEQQNAAEYVNYAMKFFENQVLDDSDIIEGEYFMQITQLPKTREEADRYAKKLQDEALHWVYPDEQEVNAEVEDDEDEEEAQVAQDSAAVAAGQNRDIFGDKKDQKSGLTFPRDAGQMQHHHHDFSEQGQDEQSNRRTVNHQRFSHLERQLSDNLGQSPSQFAAQALSGSNVNLSLIQQIKSMGQQAKDRSQLAADSHSFSNSTRDDFRRTQIESDKSLAATATAEVNQSKNRHSDNKHAPGDVDIFERDESASLF